MEPRKGPRPEKNPKPIFAGLTIAVSGFLGDRWTDKDIERWVTYRKGVFVQQMNASVTHLVCTVEEAKKKTAKVREAIKRGGKNCKIVNKDWLEDSMTKGRKLDEALYNPLKELRKEQKKEMRKKQAAKGLEEAKRTVNKNYYRHYWDNTYFTYTVTITRDDEAVGALGERYVLFLEESIAEPRLYWFFAKYYKSKANTHAHVYRPTATPGLFKPQYELFKHFFRNKTGISWDERLVKAGTPMDKKYFKYTPPMSLQDLTQKQEKLTEEMSKQDRRQARRLGPAGVRKARSSSRRDSKATDIAGAGTARGDSPVSRPRLAARGQLAGHGDGDGDGGGRPAVAGRRGDAKAQGTRARGGAGVGKNLGTRGGAKRTVPADGTVKTSKEELRRVKRGQQPARKEENKDRRRHKLRLRLDRSANPELIPVPTGPTTPSSPAKDQAIPSGHLGNPSQIHGHDPRRPQQGSAHGKALDGSEPHLGTDYPTSDTASVSSTAGIAGSVASSRSPSPSPSPDRVPSRLYLSPTQEPRPLHPHLNHPQQLSVPQLLNGLAAAHATVMGKMGVGGGGKGKGKKKRGNRQAAQAQTKEGRGKQTAKGGKKQKQKQMSKAKKETQTVKNNGKKQKQAGGRGGGNKSGGKGGKGGKSWDG